VRRSLKDGDIARIGGPFRVVRINRSPASTQRRLLLHKGFND